MIIKQLSIFVENKTGKLAQVTGMIADLGVNIHALSIADTTDFGVLRIIVDNPELTADELRSNRMTVSVGFSSRKVLSQCISTLLTVYEYEFQSLPWSVIYWHLQPLCTS